MTRPGSPGWARIALGLTFTTTAAAQNEPDPDPPAAPAGSAPDASGEPPPPPPPPPPPTIVTTTPVLIVADADEDLATYDPLSAIGVSLSAGGGAGGFTEKRLRDAAEIGGDWRVRATIGTRSPIAFEGSYIGSAQQIDALGLDNSAVLVGNGVETALRFNVVPYNTITPFLYAGAAWRRYDITNADFNTSDIRGEDDVLEFPLGFGLSGRWSGFVVDARGEFRPTTNEDLVPELSGDTLTLDRFAAMHRWGFEATVGIEF